MMIAWSALQETDQEWDSGETTLVDNALRRFLRHYSQRQQLQEQMAEGRRASEKVSFLVEKWVNKCQFYLASFLSDNFARWPQRS